MDYQRMAKSLLEGTMQQQTMIFNPSSWKVVGSAVEVENAGQSCLIMWASKREAWVALMYLADQLKPEVGDV